MALFGKWLLKVRKATLPFLLVFALASTACASSNQGNQGNQNQGNQGNQNQGNPVPEIDPGMACSMILLLLGGVLVLNDQRRR